ncbi:MAG TPA: CpsD/CapB family tyrosine-protein kinase [Pyrinomonadaceae bacterium]|jgi:capsular exopolysaccharide synthesis family protein|nr:CpsD/CapB family tyrosine-protein kinase [Pyrinomonadaceae bacterium]
MGRVYDALKRANTLEAKPLRSRQLQDSSLRGEIRTHAPVPAATPLEEQLFNVSSIAGRRESAVKSSAFTAHTANASDGMALPEGQASGAVGATLNAARPARATGLVSYDVDPARVEPHLVAITQPRSAYCEQFRSLRTRVLQAGEREQMRTFVITSAGMGEGKTLTALNLAWLLAQTEGVRALVIDSDLRQPCATDYLAIDAPQGLSEVLGGELNLREAIVRLDPAGLYLLPGGQARDDVAELLSGPTYAGVIAEARRLFDFIIIDAPPLGIFTDANVLINRADGALMVVRAGKTRYAMVDKLLSELPRERMLGVVLNRADEQLESNAYYYNQRNYRSPRVPPTEETLRLVTETEEEDDEVAIAS